MKLPSFSTGPESPSRNRRALQGGSYSIAAAAVILAILVVVNILVSALPTSMTKYDISSAKLYSVTSNTKAVLSGLDEDVTDYGQYGLDDPICTIHITAGDTDYEILLGNYSTMDSQRYVSTGDGNVYLASSDPLSSFNCTIRDLIANDETPAFGTVKGIEFAGEDSYTVTTQEYTDDNSYTACVEDYYYKTDGDTLLPLDSDRVEDYLRGIAGLSLTNYVTYNAGSEDLSVYGLDNPERTITVRYTDGTEDAEEETFTLSISRDPEEKAAAESDTGEEDEEITAYARVGESEIIYQLTQSEYESLMACSYDGLRHDEAFTAGFDRVTSVDITLEGTDYTITSEGDDEERTFWYGEEEVDLGDLRSALADALAAEFTSKAPTQKEEIRLTPSGQRSLSPDRTGLLPL